MNKSLRVAKLDFITIKPYLTWKALLVLIAIFVFVCYGTKEVTFLITMAMMYSITFASYPFAMEERNSIDMLYATLPITKRNIVKGRYIFTLTLNLVMMLLAFIVSILILNLFNIDFDVKGGLWTCIFSFVIFSLLESIQLPLYFKLGYSKAKILVYLPFVVFSAIVFFIALKAKEGKVAEFFENISIWFDANKFYTFLFGLIIWLAIMFFSLSLSSRFYEKREV